jgi:zinc D-Ala-D-Ala carboxypeptidase
MNLTPHFSLEQLTASSTALRLGIDNTPPAEILPHIQALAGGLEKVRVALGLFNNGLYIDSGYRCLALNTAIHGAADSAHMRGYAADFVCPSIGTPLEIIQTLAASDLAFDELIQEGTWIHISFDPRLRKEIFTAHFGPKGTTYTGGIT